MSVFLDIVLPVFVLLGLGYAAAALDLFDAAATRALSRFVFQFALPVMLFSSLAAQGKPAGFAPAYLVAFFAGAAVCALLTALIAPRLGPIERRGRAIAGFSSAYGNVVLIGIPLVLTAFGEAASLPLFLLVTFHGPIMMTLVTVLLEAGGDGGERRSLLIGTLKGLAANPILIGLVGGILFGATGLELPKTIAASAELLGRAALPTALFAMGASLRGYRIRGALPLAFTMVGLKLVLHPFIVWLLVDHVFRLDSPWSDVAIVLAAMPTGINAYLFAARYQSGEAEAASAVLISTALSLVSVSVILTLRLG